MHSEIIRSGVMQLAAEFESTGEPEAAEALQRLAAAIPTGSSEPGDIVEIMRTIAIGFAEARIQYLQSRTSNGAEKPGSSADT